LPRADIQRARVKRRSRRGHHALIGLAIGAGGGLAAGAALDHSAPEGWFSNLGKGVLTPVGALIGTLVGVAIPTGGWRDVYRAP
jgi:hypothetical protein